MQKNEQESRLFCESHCSLPACGRCLRCGRAICQDCRLKEKKEHFCSIRCYRLYTLENLDIRKILHTYTREDFLKKLNACVALFFLAAFTFEYFFGKEQKDTPLPPAVIAEKPAEPTVIKEEPLQAIPELPPVEIKSAESEKKPVEVKTLPAKTAKKQENKLFPSISKVLVAEKKISITFDGGSNDSSASEILDTLKSRNIKSTFFLTASFIRLYPDTVKRMVEEGHEIGNHTFSHLHLTSYDRDKHHKTLPGVGPKLIRNELKKTEEVFFRLTGRKMAPYWRAPYGEINRDILQWASEAGYRHVAWTVDQAKKETMDSLDWVSDKNSHLYLSSEEIKERLLAFADSDERAKGGIILMHLGTGRKSDIVHEKLDDIIDSFMAKGYEVVPVSDLIKSVKKG